MIPGNDDSSKAVALYARAVADAILEGTIVEMSPDAAKLLDDTFKTTAVKAGLVIGVAKITIATA